MRVAITIALCMAVIAGCGEASKDVRGSVIELEADLLEVESFTVRSDEGDLFHFAPGPDAAFDDGTPLSHLREHLRDGFPVVVTYTEADDGSLVVSTVEDG